MKWLLLPTRLIVDRTILLLLGQLWTMMWKNLWLWLIKPTFNREKRILYNGARYRCRIVSRDRSRFIGTIVLRRAMNTKCGTYTGWFYSGKRETDCMRIDIAFSMHFGRNKTAYSSPHINSEKIKFRIKKAALNIVAQFSSLARFSYRIDEAIGSRGPYLILNATLYICMRNIGILMRTRLRRRDARQSSQNFNVCVSIEISSSFLFLKRLHRYTMYICVHVIHVSFLQVLTQLCG